MNKIIKRDGRTVEFDRKRIINAVKRAFEATKGETFDDYALNKANHIADYVEKYINEQNKNVSVEDIQDIVEKGLMSCKKKDVAKEYILYRDKRNLARKNTIDDTVKDYLGGTSEYWNYENSNKDAKVLSTQRDYLAGILSTDYSRRYLLPRDVVKAHDEGILHFHDIDYFAENAITNCSLINLEDMLQNGTIVNGIKIDKPHRFITACTIATQIILGVTSNQYGGTTISLTHLAPFLRDSYNWYLKKYRNYGGLTEEQILEFAKKDTQKELEDGVQTFNYQLNSMTNSNGQSPFVSVFMYLNESQEYKKEVAMIIEEFFKQRILGFKNEVGVYITPAFPKLLYVLEEDNITPNSEYWYLTELAAKCTAKRMVPDYISEKKMKELKNGDCFPCMGCRSFLMPYKDKNGKSKYYGRLNLGVCTLNLPDIAFSSHGDFDKFWQLFDERAELCHKALRCRYERLSHVTSDVAPLLWQAGAFARLKKHEPIKPLLENNYSSISLGYAGLYECVKYMTGESHSSGKGYEFAVKVMKALKDKTDKWQAEEHLGYSVYGTPLESSVSKFANSLKRRFGKDIFIKLDGHDRNYITNSVHIPVFEEIDPFTKLKIEASFQPYSTGGYISYIECADLTHNVDAVLQVIQYIYENTMYAELNTKSDYCQKCGYNGEIKIIDVGGKLDWECPNCGNRDHDTLNVCRRTCGYLGTNFWNQGRTNEIKDRVVHLDDKTF